MTSTETFQIPLETAEVYEARFVPGLFAEWAPLLTDAAGVRPGHAVLDVACGTGVVTRAVADRLGGDGTVVGLDLNESMLTVARRVRPDLAWQQGDVAHLPFPERTFDVTLCQMSLMFFPDRGRALAEMARVTAPGGTVGIVVPAAISDQPAYHGVVSVIADEAGAEGASLVQTYWSCGDLRELQDLFESAGLTSVTARTHTGTAHFDTIDGLVITEVEGSPLIDRIDDATYRRITERSREVLARFVTGDGALHAPLVGHIVTGIVPA
ncbi:methyltransferase domain-containing protein [Phytoactinopolyspora halotolerans]|uniref:Methyltransferase domain-containing protein n=1 Tax=Phytoactinopolyspora halotolerans TaxID=1981512 RepID=A0A6L9SGL9_9ACTN|nr:methyltransferase domain-containing protein [Phytoactinopolyspora halotolerans]NEE03764.1 methyltransferase domain-containing protein [Phytoactinopolyspora halotolerans]